MCKSYHAARGASLPLKQASLEGFQSAGVDREGADHYIKLAVDLVVQARNSFWSSHVAAHDNSMQATSGMAEGRDGGRGSGERKVSEACDGSTTTSLADHGDVGGALNPELNKAVIGGRQKPLVGFSCGSYGAR